MCADSGKKHLYIIYIHTYVYARIYAISAWSSREQNQLKRRFKTCVCQNWFVSAPAKYPYSPVCAPDLPCSMHGSSIPQFPIQHGQFSSQRHMQKKKKKKKQNTAAKTLNDGALQLTNRQWDRQTDRQANRRSDSGTGSSRTAAQHTLGQLHTNTHTHTPAPAHPGRG